MSEDMLDQIKKEIAANEIVMFIKGTKEMPMCGFSARTNRGSSKSSADRSRRSNILPDPRIRQTLSAFSNWPTIPQVFIKGKGSWAGCDIVTEMYQKGELKAARSKPPFQQQVARRSPARPPRSLTPVPPGIGAAPVRNRFQGGATRPRRP